jgi:hypothetical protein
MKRIALLFVLVALFVAAMPIGADTTTEYWAWHSRTDSDIYCWGPSVMVGPEITNYYEYRQVGGKTVYCDGSESTWGATWCEVDVRPGGGTPCYQSSVMSVPEPPSTRPYTAHSAHIDTIPLPRCVTE